MRIPICLRGERAASMLGLGTELGTFKGTYRIASVPGLENEKQIQSVHSEQNRYFNVSVPAFLMYYYRSETGYYRLITFCL